MRQTKRFISLAVLAASTFAAPAYAYMGSEGDINGRWGVGFTVAGSAPTDQDGDGNVYLGGNALYGVNENVALQLDLGYTEFSIGSFGIDYGDLEGVPLIFSLQWRKPFSIGTSPAAWYLLGGLGVVFWDFQNSDTVEQANIPTRAEDAFAVRLGGGFDLFITQNIAWNVEGHYTFSDARVELTQQGTGQTEDVDTDFWQLGTGLRYFF
jgi:outer membrane protein W